MQDCINWIREPGASNNFYPTPATRSISYQNIHGLVACGNELWIGTYEHGLDVMDLRDRKSDPPLQGR